MNITAQLEKVGILVKENDSVPFLKKLTDSIVLSVEIHSISGIEPLHELGKIPLRSHQHHGKLIIHQAETMHPDIIHIKAFFPE